MHNSIFLYCSLGDLKRTVVRDVEMIKNYSITYNDGDRQNNKNVSDKPDVANNEEKREEIEIITVPILMEIEESSGAGGTVLTEISTTRAQSLNEIYFSISKSGGTNVSSTSNNNGIYVDEIEGSVAEKGNTEITWKCKLCSFGYVFMLLL